MKPILKWIGGKTKLLDCIHKYMPHEFNSYIEPFTGGGAVFFSTEASRGLINDVNAELINFYSVVRDHPTDIYNRIPNYKIDEESYYQIRNIDREVGWKGKMDSIERASRFLYLNKTAFNGMWRENKSGHVNVPFGFYDNPSFPSEETLLSASEKLKGFEMTSGDFKKTLSYINEGDFVYMDPPYIPYSVDGFTSYSAEGFTENDQRRLVSFCEYIDSIGANFMVSNSDTELTRELYSKYDIIPVSVYHSVGAQSGSTNKRGEVIVRNFKHDNTIMSYL